MFIPVVCIILSVTLAYFLWQKTNDTKYRCALVLGVIIIFVISGQYIKLTKDEFLEGFEVQMLDADSEPDVINSPKYDTDNSYLDKDEELAVNGGSASMPDNKPGKIKSIAELDSMAKAGLSQSVKNIPAKSRRADKFNNIIQKDTGGEQSSVFNPQIILMGNGGASSGSTGNSNANAFSLNASTSSAVNNQIASSSQSSSATTVNNFGVTPRVIDEYLKPRNDIFNGGSGGDSGSANPFEWMKDFLHAQNSRTGNANGSTASCPVSKPYADDSVGRFNSATLTNRTYIPGMSYMPPAEWNMPQTRDNTCRQVCNNIDINTRALPIGIMDHGTPVFALEIGDDGTIAKTEGDVRYTNVGSIMPKFEFREYVDCPGPQPTGSSTATTTTKAG